MSGRGGWSWYTGSAAWMHRAAIEHLFGLQQRGDEVGFAPSLPTHWPQAELTLRRDGRSLRVIFCRADCEPATLDADFELQRGQMLRWADLPASATALLRLAATPGALAELRLTQPAH